MIAQYEEKEEEDDIGEQRPLSGRNSPTNILNPQQVIGIHDGEYQADDKAACDPVCRAVFKDRSCYLRSTIMRVSIQ